MSGVAFGLYVFASLAHAQSGSALTGFPDLSRTLSGAVAVRDGGQLGPSRMIRRVQQSARCVVTITTFETPETSVGSNSARADIMLPLRQVTRLRHDGQLLVVAFGTSGRELVFRTNGRSTMESRLATIRNVVRGCGGTAT